MPLLRAMKFIDEGGKPTSRYHSFLDDTQWKRVLAEGVKDAYPDLFRVNRNAHTQTRESLSGKIKSLTEGKLSESLVANTTKTFLELVKLADFSDVVIGKEETDSPEPDELDLTPSRPPTEVKSNVPVEPQRSEATLVYRIEIVLPAVRDQAVYDAIFRSAKEHLMR